MSGRFSSPVMPGEALTVRIWETGEGQAVFQTVGPDGRVVLDAGQALRPAGSRALVRRGAGRRLDAPQGVVVDLDARDVPAAGEHPGLGLDLLGHEHAPDRAQHRVALQELQVAGELLDAVDLAPALDLDGHRLAVGVPAQQVDGADVGGVLAPDQPQARAMASQLAASSSWRWASTPSFRRPGSTPSSWLLSDSTSSA